MKTRLGSEIFSLIKELYPICRSITGEGVRETLKIISKTIPIQINEIKTGTKIFDWEIPKEWNVNDAYIIDPDGRKFAEFKKLNLHLLNYSIPFNGEVEFQELKKHLFTIPEQPELIPYRTSYYNENWGFCIAHNEFKNLSDGKYKVYIDTKLKSGVLNWGEYYIKGETEDEVLLTTHICHPSLCNDNLSGISILTHLVNTIQKKKLKYSYRFLFIPGTVGSITWLAQNKNRLNKIKYGLVMTLLGDSHNFTYKKSRRGDSLIDNAIKLISEINGNNIKIKEFIPFGYDERQFCSPGINLPVGCLTRSSYGEFPEYHTSADNLDFINEKNLLESYNFILDLILFIETNKKYLNLFPMCEPQLGKRDIYSAISGSNNRNKELALLWILNYSDGNNSLQDIAYKSKINIDVLEQSAKILERKGLIKEYW